MNIPSVKIPEKVQKIFDESRACRSDEKLINRIMMVGALLDDFGLLLDDSGKAELAGHTQDANFLAVSSYKAMKMGFSFHDDVQVDVCNLEYGHSFFDVEDKADIVIFCNLFFNRSGAPFPSVETQQDDAGFNFENWKISFQKTQSRLVVNTGFEGVVYASLPQISRCISATGLFERAGESVSFSTPKEEKMGFSYKADFFNPKIP